MTISSCLTQRTKNCFRIPSYATPKSGWEENLIMFIGISSSSFIMKKAFLELKIYGFRVEGNVTKRMLSIDVPFICLKGF